MNNQPFSRFTRPATNIVTKNVSKSIDFFQSNNLITKFAFIILVVIIFGILLRLGTMILGMIFSPNKNPILIDGMVDAKQLRKIPQDPSVKGSIPILRSQNQRDGMEFTWSVWILIDDITYKENQYKHVFHKGNDDINMSKQPYGLNFPNNGPGLYIAPHTNDLVVVMNTFETINEEIVIKDIPIRKWINVIIRLNKQHQLDIFINGRLARRHILRDVPKQNYGDVYVSMNGGFSGYTSSLRYFAYSLGLNEIQSIVFAGPNMKMLESDNMKDSIPQYLSLRWFFSDSGTQDMYN